MMSSKNTPLAWRSERGGGGPGTVTASGTLTVPKRERHDVNRGFFRIF